MNNDAYRTKDMASEELGDEQIHGQETRRLVVLRRLMTSPDFKFFLSDFIQPRHDTQLKKLRTTGIIEEAFRAQGALVETGYLLEGLTSHLEALKNTIDHAEKPEEAGTTEGPAASRSGRNARRRKA